jgi:hypothetical protein
MRHFLATKNEGENMYLPLMWGEILPRWNIDTILFHRTATFFNTSMTHSTVINTLSNIKG